MPAITDYPCIHRKRHGEYRENQMTLCVSVVKVFIAGMARSYGIVFVDDR